MAPRAFAPVIPLPRALSHLTVAQKIAGGYLLVTVFCLAAAVYALVSLDAQTRETRDLVAVEFQATTLARDLRGIVLAQERLERQALILRDPAYAELLARRNADFAATWERFERIPRIPGQSDPVGTEGLAAELLRATRKGRTLFDAGRWDEAAALSEATLSPLRNQLLGDLDRFLREQDRALDATLRGLSRKSQRAYRLTMTLALAGVALAGLVAGRLIYKLSRNFRHLTRATEEIAAGNFDPPTPLDSPDEFGELARAFIEMGRQLKELESLRLDANPLTHLPGNRTIERELEARIAAGRLFAHLYADLDHFKAYNDRYGYAAGSQVITRVGQLVQDSVRRIGNPEDLVGHVGGDDYVILSTPDRAEPIAGDLIANFDRVVPEFYSPEDRAAGFFLAEDRFGVERRFPLLTLSVAVLTSANLKDPSAEAIGRECAKIKEHLKRVAGSNYLVDRREGR